MKYSPLFILLACNSDKGITSYNSSPEVIITSHETGDTLYIGQEILFRAIASDSNHSAENLTTKWFSDSLEICVDTELDVDGSTSCSHIITESTNRIMIEVQDPKNAAGSDFIDITPIQSNTPPSCSISAPSQGEAFRTTENVVFIGSVSDNEQSVDSLSIQWLLDGTFFTTSTADHSGLVIMESSYTAGEHLVTLSVTDDSGDTCTAERTINLTAPLEVILLPNPATGTDELFAFASGGSGINSLPPEYTFTWFQNTVVSSITGESVPSSFTTKGEIWRVEIQDSSGSQEIAFDEIVISNTLPIMDNLSVLPNLVYTNDTLQAQSSTVDNDGDLINVTYEWFVDGVMIYDGGDTLDGSIYFNKNQEVYAQATPNDDEGFGAPITSTPIIVQNTPPNAPIISITPSSVTEDVDLHCMIDTDSIDDDGDAVTYTYEWFVDGISSGNTTPTVSASDTQLEEEWTCEVTPNDGSLVGDIGVAAVIISLGDSDGDGVLDVDDICPGFDDNLDSNGNGLPDDCESNLTFVYTGAEQTWIVPSTVTEIVVEAYGAQGGAGNASVTGGLGGYAIANIPVTPGETLEIRVGGQGTSTISGGQGGYNGGGSTYSYCCNSQYSGSGGGASDVRTSPYSLTERMIVAGGGGGGGSSSYSSNSGGAGGGLTGSDGMAPYSSNVNVQAGTGGTQTSGGSAHQCCGSNYPNEIGTFGQGGSCWFDASSCGAGGGGWYGGGAGSFCGAGGGSSYIGWLGSTNTNTSSGVQSGNGQIIISYIIN